MRIKIKTLGPGLHPSQVVVGLETRTGEEALVVDRGHIEGDFIDIGWPVGQSDGYYLVELPSETFRGSWRVWVNSNNLLLDDIRPRKFA